MNVSQLKTLTWIAALVAGGYLVFSVYDFWDRKDELAEGVSEEIQRKALESDEPLEETREELVDYKAVKDAFHTMDWTGKPPPVVVIDTGPEDEGDKTILVVAMSELIRVLLLRVDTRDETGSMAMVRYINPVMSSADPEGLLVVGDHLPAPHEYALVKAIQADGIVFSFDNDGEREPELVGPSELPKGSGIVVVGADGVIVPKATSRITGTPPDWVPPSPRQTQQIRPNHFQIGVDSQRYISENWSQILSSEVRTASHKNRINGRLDGIEIKQITAGSVASEYGVQTGDVIKSINGHPVSTKNQAIQFVKNNDDRYDRWVVVIERQGKEVDITYEEPG